MCILQSEHISLADSDFSRFRLAAKYRVSGKSSVCLWWQREWTCNWYSENKYVFGYNKWCSVLSFVTTLSSSPLTSPILLPSSTQNWTPQQIWTSLMSPPTHLPCTGWLHVPSLQVTIYAISQPMVGALKTKDFPRREITSHWWTWLLRRSTLLIYMLSVAIKRVYHLLELEQLVRSYKVKDLFSHIFEV